MKKNSIFAMLMLFVLLGMAGCGKSPVSTKSRNHAGIPNQDDRNRFRSSIQGCNVEKDGDRKESDVGHLYR